MGVSLQHVSDHRERCPILDDLVSNVSCSVHTVRGVRGLGIRMLTIDTKTSLYTEDRGLQVPMTLEHDKIVGTQFCDTLSRTS